MIVADTSVTIAAFASWHAQHEPAREVVRSGASVVAHSLLETYSVLTRLPEPHRVAGAVVAEYLGAQFPSPIALDRRGQRTVVGSIARAGIAGGAAYDALIAFTARAHGATLVSLDRRAAATYARCDVRFELLTA